MNDFIGQPLAVGDKVIFMWKRWRDRRQLNIGTIKSMAEQTCLIEYRGDGPGGWKQRQFYDQVIRHPDQRGET